MAFARAASPPLTPELLEAALAGVSVRRLAALGGMSRADAQGLARWAGPLLDAMSAPPAAEAGPGGEIVFRQTATAPGACTSAPPQEKTQSAAPAQEEEKTTADMPAPMSDVVVPEPYASDPELRAIYIEAYARAEGRP